MLRLILLALGTLLSLSAAAEPQLLRAEQAFRYTAVHEGGEVVVRWQAADGYYMYQDRFGFRSLDPAVSLGEPVMPAGLPYEDEFFGATTIHRGDFEIRVPMTGAPGDAPFPIEIRSQGCADIGVCLPPQTWQAEVASAAAAAPGPAAGTPGPAAERPRRSLLSFLTGNGAPGQQAFLPPQEAFKTRAWRDGERIVLEWDIAPGYYLYRDKFGVSADGVELPAGFPAGEIIHDETFGDVEVLFDSAATSVVPPQGVEALVARYQGCAKDGICYPPEKWTVTLAGLGAAPAGAAGATSRAGSAGNAISGAAAGQAPVSETDRLAALISDGSLPAVLGVFFGLGLLLAFTPCVLPMVPILSGLIVGQGAGLTTRRAFSLSAVFVLAMALTYTIAGVVVALLGYNLQAAFQHPAVLSGFAVVFLLLALAMFGFYELQVPASLQAKLINLSNRQRSGTWIGAGAMGVFSALIVGPCVAAPLAAALIVIGATGDPVRGGAALFALSMGMGAPLLAFGASAGKILPRAGAWMVHVNNLFGLLLLAVAVWMLERIVPPAVTLALWAGLLLLAAVFLGAVEPLKPDAGPGRRIAKGLGLMSLLYGAVLLVGAAAGGQSPWQPLSGLRAPAQGIAATATTREFKVIKTVADLERELRAAGAAGRTTLLDFYADWCVDCKRMERYTFPEPAVQAALGDTLLLKADVTANDDADRELMNRFNIFGPPATLFFGPDGDELRPYRLLGFVPAERFAQHVRTAQDSAGERP
ncbi:protein-disulfide reductase DsbD [Thioalkalivibrio sp. XN279]|uniref:protein-disulfide reductase DsbD n=1 Tax=Thioalkalivibrio sp. XN279 TaxID=2714953 RepID=UPI0014084254|nr:protein-disulfide reductase DsbD [Thioalkalivibrio sp. XN279]NHA16145.1 protein-disulfide reductase DsbD [Thioalkalivibrio sp. XN279]